MQENEEAEGKKNECGVSEARPRLGVRKKPTALQLLLKFT